MAGFPTRLMEIQRRAGFPAHLNPIKAIANCDDFFLLATTAGNEAGKKEQTTEGLDSFTWSMVSSLPMMASRIRSDYEAIEQRLRAATGPLACSLVRRQRSVCSG